MEGCRRFVPVCRNVTQAGSCYRNRNGKAASLSEGVEVQKRLLHQLEAVDDRSMRLPGNKPAGSLSVLDSRIAGQAQVCGCRSVGCAQVDVTCAEKYVERSRRRMRVRVKQEKPLGVEVGVTRHSRTSQGSCSHTTQHKRRRTKRAKNGARAVGQSGAHVVVLWV